MISGACNDAVQITSSVVVMTQCLQEISMPTPSEGQLLDEIDVTRQHTKPSMNKSIYDANTIEEVSLKARKEEMRISLESKKTLLESKKKALELARNLNSSMGEQLKLKPINALLETGGLDCIELSTNQMTAQSAKSLDDDKVRFSNGTVLLPIDFCETEEENECENDDGYTEKSIYTSTNKMLNCTIDEHWSDELKAYYRSGGVYSNKPPAFWGSDYNHEAQLPTPSGHFRGHQQNGNARFMNGYTEGMRSSQVVNSNGIALENQNRRNFGASQDIRHSNRLREQEQQRRSQQQLPTSNHQSYNEKKPEKSFQQQHQPGNSQESSIASDRHRQHFRGDDSWQKQQHPKWKEKNNNIPAQNFNGTKQRHSEQHHNMQQHNMQQQPRHREHETQQQTRWHPHHSSRNKQHSNWRNNAPNNDRRNNANKRAALVDSHARFQNQPDARRGKRSKPDGDDT